MKRDTQYKLRRYLRLGGVYVEQNNNRVSIPQAFLNVLEEEEQRAWTNDVILKPGPVRTELRVGPITSVNITLNGVELLEPVEQSNQTPTSPENNDLPIQEQGAPLPNEAHLPSTQYPPPPLLSTIPSFPPE